MSLELCLSRNLLPRNQLLLKQMLTKLLRQNQFLLQPLL